MMLYTFVFLILFGFSLLVLISIVFWSVRNGISPMPSSKKAKSAIFDLIPKDYLGTIYELGSGWGTLAIALAKKYPKSCVVGFETSFFPYYFSKLWKWQSGLDNVILLKKDFFKTSLENASLIVCYLYPGAMRKLKDQFEKELKPRTMVISNTFSCPNWDALQIIELKDLYKTKVYLYKKKP